MRRASPPRKWSTPIETLPSEFLPPKRAISDVTGLFAAMPKAAEEEKEVESVPVISRVSSTATEILAEIGEKLSS